MWHFVIIFEIKFKEELPTRINNEGGMGACVEEITKKNFITHKNDNISFGRKYKMSLISISHLHVCVCLSLPLLSKMNIFNVPYDVLIVTHQRIAWLRELKNFSG